MLCHARRSRYVCNFCDKAFYTPNTLKSHFKRHLRKQISVADESKDELSVEDFHHGKRKSQRIKSRNGKKTHDTGPEQSKPVKR